MKLTLIRCYRAQFFSFGLFVYFTKMSVVEIVTRVIHLNILFISFLTSDVIELADLLFAAASKSYIEGAASRLIPAR